MEFTQNELVTMSNGILALIRDAGEAKKLIHSNGTLWAIDAEIEGLVALNSKICSKME